MPIRHRRLFGCAVAVVGVAVACREASTVETTPPQAMPTPSANDGVDASSDAGTPEAEEKDAAATSGPKSALHFTGRFDMRDSAGPRFSWPGTKIRTRFSGTGATIRLNGTGNDQLDVSVDGKPPTVLKTTPGTGSYSLVSDLPDGEHDLVVTKRTEPLVGQLQLISIESTEKRALIPTAATEPKRFIEFVGDSITCGYGVLGASPCKFTPDTEDEQVAYGALTASLVGADHAAISWSGIGAYRDFGGSTNEQMPTRFGYALADDPTSTWDFSYTPDVVVVNLGTNDFAAGDPGMPYQNAMTSFATLLRSKYPTAHIVLTVSAMLSGDRRTGAETALRAVVAKRTKAGDKRITFFEFDAQLAGDGLGCDGHPNRTTSQKSAEKLATYLRSLTGW
jgi:lysophospholipase L1-like esterase